MKGLYEYSGALCIKYKKCGKVHTFVTKHKLIYAACDCGTKTEFTEPLRPLWANHECGSRRRYMTNLKDKMADVECCKCGAPVTVEWNPRKKCYTTVKN